MNLFSDSEYEVHKKSLSCSVCKTLNSSGVDESYCKIVTSVEATCAASSPHYWDRILISVERLIRF